MSEREGSTAEEGRSEADLDRLERSEAGERSETRAPYEDIRREGDREVWSGALEAAVTDTDVEAGEWRRAEQFED
jgi:hypothetical protein